ncbi:MAG: ribonuclease Z [Bacteroidaceae bacterium]|jgi:ribonuclease Z|nr:ribonuclease Z [Bacteroidaceae bacterium]
MEKFEVTILGCGCALPTMRHFGASQVVNIHEKLFMVDCAEATQLQFRRNRLKFSHLGHIFITHLHGDHFFGVIGIISTMSLLGRTSTLHVWGPQGIEEALQPQINMFCQGMTFNVEIHTLDAQTHQKVYEDRSVEIYTIPLRHRVPCCGYLFKEKPLLPHILRDMIEAYDIPISQINNIKLGMDYTCPDGTVIPHTRLTTPADPPRSFAYCSDTTYKPDIIPIIKDVDLLYHEATFTDEEEKAASRFFHSTASQAATIARDCHAHRLCIGHFSSRYDDESIFLDQARAIFPETVLARENLVIPLTIEH